MNQYKRNESESVGVRKSIRILKRTQVLSNQGFKPTQESKPKQESMDVESKPNVKDFPRRNPARKAKSKNFVNVVEKPDLVNSNSEYEDEKEDQKDYCEICNDILLNHMYGNVCKKHIPSYALHDDKMYKEMILQEFETLPNTKIERNLLKKRLNFFRKSKKYMSLNEKTLGFIMILKNGYSLYLNSKDGDPFKQCFLRKCNEIIYDDKFYEGLGEFTFKNKLISYVKTML